MSRSKHGEDHTAPSEWRPEVDDKLSDHNMERTLEKRLAQSILVIIDAHSKRPLVGRDHYAPGSAVR